MHITYKVVLNGCYGGFGLSQVAVARLKELGVKYEDDYEYNEMERNDPLLIQVVEELGEEASDDCSRLHVAEVNTPLYIIEEHDGLESIKTTNSFD